MRQLLDAGIMESYAPLVENKGAMTAQFEHVSFLSPISEFLDFTDILRQSCCTVEAKKSSVEEMTTSLALVVSDFRFFQYTVSGWCRFAFQSHISVLLLRPALLLLRSLYSIWLLSVRPWRM